jgi:predicted CXXCH cytochrome family protein
VQLSARAGAVVAVLVFVTLGVGCPGRSDLTFGIGAAEHAAYFPIDAASVHALDRVAVDGAIGCASCHAAEESFADFSCVSCHEHRQRGVDPDGSRGMDEVHAGDGAYRYESASCLSCHPGGLAAEISRAEHERFFPIDTGTPHVVTNCAGCHTDTGNRAVVTCTGCHQDTDGDGAGDHDAAPMDAAHGTGMGALGYVWETSRCLTCHPRGEDPGRLDAHDDAFPIATGAVHAGRACTDCHASRQDRGALTCTACHEGESAPDAGDGEHGEARMLQAHNNGAIDGYSWDSVACYGCHQQSQVPGVLDHERFFPIGAGTTHALGTSIDTPAVLVSCQSCHVDPGNARNVDCLSCHAHDEATLAPTHTPFPDYRHESESCVFCHQGGQLRLDHPFFPVAGGTVHALDNADTPAVVDGLLCGECHASQINRTLLSCTSCHEHTATIEADHHGAELSRFGYRHEPAACFTCHRQAQVPGLMDHEPIWPLQAPSGNGRHANRPCVDCHTSRENRAANLSCTACHEPTSAADTRDVHGEPRLAEVHNGISGYAFTPTVCVDCHRDGTGAGAAANLPHDRFPIGAGTTHAVTGNGGQIDCIDCHTTAGRFDLATLDCRACHLQVDDGGGARDVHGEPRLGALHAGVTDYAWSTPSCLECHPNGEPLGTFAHDDFPITTGTAHDGVGCNECHGSTNRTDRTALQCAQCHTTTVNGNPTVTQIHTGVPAFGATSPDCLRCHPTANKVGPMEHNPYFPVDVGTAHGGAAYQAKVTATETSCTACHLSRTDRAQNDCAACHATVPPALATAHSRVRGFSATNSAGCKECHADADVFRLSAHRAFDPRHEGARCNQCHQRRRTDKPWAINFTGPTNCVGCHHNAGCSYTNQGPCD